MADKFDTTETMTTEVSPATSVAESDGRPRMNLGVDIHDDGPCKKHVHVTIPREDIDALSGRLLKDFISRAQVPGFRVGRVPRSLVERRFRKEVADQVKQQLLVQSMEQLAEEHQLDAINEPELDLETLDIPETGDFTYSFSVEVRPAFEIPNYSGLKIKRPVRDVSDADVDAYLSRYLAQFGQLQPLDGPAAAGDFIEAEVHVHAGEQHLLHTPKTTICLKPTVRFRDGELAKFDELMVGVKAGETRTASTKISVEAPTAELRGEAVSIEFIVADVKRLKLPELDAGMLESLGSSSVEELRKSVRNVLQRQVTYEQRQQTRRQVLAAMTESANWELPESLVRRQVENALRREVLEMQQAGFTDDDIRAKESDLLQRQISMTRQALKEHFVLDKLASQEQLSVSPEDIDLEVMYMAMQRGENPRKVRARLEKQGLIENLEAQILERKAVDFILSKAEFEDTPMPRDEAQDVEGVSLFLTGHAEGLATDVDD